MSKRRSAAGAAVIMAIAAYLFFGLHGADRNDGKVINVNTLPDEIAATDKMGLGAYKYINAVVTKVVDGDTFEAVYKSKSYKVRLLDVDTPESVKSGVTPQVYGKEASKVATKYLSNKRVKLVFEKGLRDRYGRLLAHVVLEDGTYFNGFLVRNGYARVEFVSPNNACKEYFQDMQELARREKLGVWGLPADKQPFVKNSKGEYVPRYWIKDKAS